MRHRNLAIAAASAVIVLALAGAAAIRYSGIEERVLSIVERRLLTALGRPVEIAGPVSVTPSMSPTVTTGSITVSNVPWSEGDAMFRAEGVVVTVSLAALLLGDVVIEEVVFRQPEVLVETTADGRLNWRRDSAEDGSARSFPAFPRHLVIEDGILRWRRPQGELVAIGIEHLDLTDDPSGSTLKATGGVNGVPFDLAATGGQLADLITRSPTFPFELGGSFGPLTLHASGDAGVTASGATLTAVGDRLEALTALVGTALPALGPFEATVQLGAEAPEGAAAGFTARLADEGWGEATAAGTLDTPSANASLAGTIALAGNDLALLGERLGLALPASGPYQAEAGLAGSATAPSLTAVGGRIDLGAAGLLTVTGGTIEVLDREARFAVPVSGGGTDLAATLALLGIATTRPAGPWQASGEVIGTPEAFSIENLEVEAGTEQTAVVEARGRIDGFATADGPRMDLHVAASGNSIAALLPLPDGPAETFSASADLAGSSATLEVAGLHVEVAGSIADASGTVTLSDDGPPAIAGQIEASRLDADRLSRLFGGSAEAGEESDLPLHLLFAVRLSLTLRAEELLVEETTLADVRADIAIHDGRLEISRLSARAEGGTVAGAAAVEPVAPASRGPPEAALTLQLSAQSLDAEDLAAAAGAPGKAAGAVDVTLSIDAAGRTLDELVASLDGTATAVAEHATIADTQLDRLTPDVDVLRILPFFWRRAESIRVNCAVVDLAAQDGVVEAEALLDTPRMTVLGEGSVDLDEGTLDLAIDPMPKSGKLSAAGVSAEIRGTLDEPEVIVEPGETAGRLIGGALGGLLVPLNQIAGLFGGATADACVQAVSGARGRFPQAQ